MKWVTIESGRIWCTMDGAEVPGGVVLRIATVGPGDLGVSLCFVPNVRLTEVKPGIFDICELDIVE